MYQLKASSDPGRAVYPGVFWLSVNIEIVSWNLSEFHVS
jgi:hypothetical protein